MNVERVKIDVAKLKIGLPLKYGLETIEGTKLARAGAVVTAEMKDQWLTAGIQVAIALVRHNLGMAADHPEKSLPDPMVVKRLEETINQASEFVLNTAQRIVSGEPTSISEVKDMVKDIRNGIATDISAVLTAFSKSLCVQPSDHDLLLAQRSSQLSLLGLLIAQQLGYDEYDLQATAMAGLFHDISLLDCVGNRKHRLTQETYTTHPFRSAALFDAVIYSNPKVSIVISQLHEQIDGTGFPYQLRLGRINPLARILNVADAYLTLVSQKEPELFAKACSFHPADAIGYLMYHAARGRFDRKAVRALIDAASLYPVGCRVELSDKSTAIVLRTTTIDPVKPIVRLEQPQSRIVDLRSSSLSISGPTLSPMDHYSRLRKAKIGDVYWR